jgi:hypothetical protein
VLNQNTIMARTQSTPPAHSLHHSTADDIRGGQNSKKGKKE